MVDVKAFTNEDEPFEAFLELPARVYADDPKWIPPLRAEVARQTDPERAIVDGHHARNFVAHRGEPAVARCSAIINPELRLDGHVVGQVGFFEALDDGEAVTALLDEATGWLKEQGIHTVWGPMNYSIWHAYRLMTRGFETEPFLGEPYNPPYYPTLFEAYGFAPHARWYSWDLALPHLKGMQMASEQLKGPYLDEGGYRYEPFRMDDKGFAEDMERAHTVLSDAFSPNLGFTPLPFAEFAAIFGGMRAFLVPELSPFAVDPEGATIGVGYLFPDVGYAFRQIEGDAGRLGELETILKETPPSRLVFHTMASLKSARRKGLVEAYLNRLLGELFQHGGFTSGVGALAKEGPTIYHKTGEPSREYTLYAKSLEG